MMMKITKNILTVLILMAMNSLIINAQEVQIMPDTSAVRQQKARKVQEKEQ